MCNPMVMALGSFAIQAASGVAEYAGGVEAYNDNEQYRIENIKRSNENARRMYDQSLTRMGQEEDAAAAEKMQVAREGRAIRATATVAAGESGAGGLSPDALLRDFYGQEANYTDRISQNTEMTLEQLNNEMYGIKAQAEDRNNSIPKGRPPSLFATALKIGGSAMGSYGQYRSWTQ